ncbi:MAG: hypothetical protein HS104_03695 [Polyangiaceae bacterium]|nr:hypothetical protein [Polyangiaceae bacterium]MBK8999456.1 hypothetical protein [Myxococcales bacterium]MCE7891999.1 hypothetical protein [Sorangiineae bacterium PRO1]MCL4750504.1 hypothetical protein [Myxococcales bacterium]
MRSVLLLLAVSAFGCSANPPPRWQEGGAPIVIAPARWDRPDDDSIQIHADGKVTEDGDLLFVLDRAGRVVDKDYEPVAILMPDGHVGGPDNVLLGRVGHANAAPPGSAAAWLAVMPNGQVVRFDDEGDRHDAGVWYGCEGPQKRTCTLVTHVLWVRNYMRNSRGGVSVGVGVMMTP